MQSTMNPSHHPIQAILCTRSGGIVTASGPSLSYITPPSLVPSAQLLNSHKGMIRLLNVFYDSATNKEYLISICEEKVLLVSELPSLEVKSERELVKRANALCLAVDSTIIIGDKFGDVYTYPLHAAPEIDASGKNKSKPPPILGHVSMVNTMVYVPPTLIDARNALLITGDRDAHVRVSRFPQGFVIERYIWGSKLFVSALLHLPVGPQITRSSVVVAGGDSTINIYETETGKLIKSIAVQDLMMPYVVVNPIAPTPVPAGKHKDKRGEKGKAKAAVETVGLETDPSTGETLAVATPELMLSEATEPDQKDNTETDVLHQSTNLNISQHPLRKSRHKWKDGETPGFAALKMVLVRDCAFSDQSGILVLVAGATAVLYIPLSTLSAPPSASSGMTDVEVPPLERSLEHEPLVIDLSRPVLDIAVEPDGKRFWLSLDTSKGAQELSELRYADSPVLSGSISNGAFKEDPTSSTSSSSSSSSFSWVNVQTALTDSNPFPDVHALYPTLQQLEPPQAEFEPDNQVDNSHTADQDPSVGVTGMDKKRSIGLAFNDQDAVKSRAKSGRRAKGRLDAQLKLEEVRKNLTAAAKEENE